MMPGVLSSGIPQYGFVKSIVHLRNFDFDRERGLQHVVQPPKKPAILEKPASPMHSLLDSASGDGFSVMEEAPPPIQAYLEKVSERAAVDIVA